MGGALGGGGALCWIVTVREALEQSMNFEVSAAVVETLELTPSVQENQAETDDTSAIKTIAFGISGDVKPADSLFPRGEGCVSMRSSDPDARDKYWW